MARKWSTVVFMTLVIVAMLQSSLAQTTHVVGDELGWNVPPGGEIAYRTWAASETFIVGDVLVFNFITGTHDVAEVTKSAFDSCSASNPISMSTNGPTNITLTIAGEHFFICTFTRHCDLGQKLAINVSAASTSSPPAAPPTTPSSPAPSSSRTPVTYTVGDGLGWTVPPGGPIAYETWARDKTFMVGDILLFNYSTGVHDAAEVTKTSFDSCNSTSPISISTDGPTRITLTSAGEHFFICTIPRHCDFGQKLAINVSGTSMSPAPQPATPPPAVTQTPTPSPVPAATPAPTPSPVPASPSPSSTATSPSGSAPTPSSPATPPPSSGRPSTQLSPSNNPGPRTSVTAPPPSNSAPSFGVAALPFTLLCIALAFLYY